MTTPAGHHDVGAECGCVAEHRPAPLEYVEHHVWPLGMGGPDLPVNRVWLCPTTHYNVHEVLRMLMRYGPMTWGELEAAIDRPLSRYAVGLARRGYNEWRAHHVPFLSKVDTDDPAAGDD